MRTDQTPEPAHGSLLSGSACKPTGVGARQSSAAGQGQLCSGKLLALSVSGRWDLGNAELRGSGGGLDQCQSCAMEQVLILALGAFPVKTGIVVSKRVASDPAMR